MTWHKATAWFWIAMLILLFVLGITVRWTVLRAQTELTPGRTLPFTLESALQFRMVQHVVNHGMLPSFDRDIQYPDGVDIFRTYTAGAEYVYGALAAMLPDSLPLIQRVRWVALCWFCLGIPLLAVWIRYRFNSRAAGLVAGAFYAVAISSVMRSTGQELSRENFALPLLVGHLAMNAVALHAGSRRRGMFATAGFWAALLLALSVMTWDLIQFYVLLWALWGWFCFVLRPSKVREQQDAWSLWLTQLIALLAAACLNPYLAAHAWYLSPGMLLAYGVCAGCLLVQTNPRWFAATSGRWLIPVAVSLLPLMAGCLLARGYTETYGHFVELLMAKLRFLNQKPADPALLTFNQRIMWVPALHSATWVLTWRLFPAMLLLSIGSAAGLMLSRKKHPSAGIYQLVLYFVASLIAFVFFVRFYVFLALFATALMGGLVAAVCRLRRWPGYAVACLLAVGWFAELRHTLAEPWQWGRPNVYYEELQELTDWLKEHVSPEVVLANFGLSASVLTYGECPIVLHPKFENKTVRNRVKAYGESLFTNTEKEFRDWIEQFDAQFYVYSLGAFSRRHPERQMRYFVNALAAPEDAAARIFEYKPYETRYFRYLWGNRKYRVFQVITRQDQHLAQRQVEAARAALRAGDLAAAEEQAVTALKLDPANQEAAQVIHHVSSLREQEFEYEPWPPGDTP